LKTIYASMLYLKRPPVCGWLFFLLVTLITGLIVAVAGIGCPARLSTDGVDE